MDFFKQLFNVNSASQHVNSSLRVQQPPAASATTSSTNSKIIRKRTWFGLTDAKSNKELEEKKVTGTKQQPVHNQKSTASTLSAKTAPNSSARSFNYLSFAYNTANNKRSPHQTKCESRDANALKVDSQHTSKEKRSSILYNLSYTNSDRKASKSVLSITTSVRDETMDNNDRAGGKSTEQWTLLSSSPIDASDGVPETLSKILDAASLLDTDTSDEEEEVTDDFLKVRFLDRHLICSLEDEIQIKDGNYQPTEEFMNYLYLLLKSFLIQECKDIDRRMQDPTMHSSLTPVLMLIEDMLSEINFVHANKQSTVVCQNVTDEGLMPHILETIIELIPADKCLTAEQLQEINLLQMRGSLRSPFETHLPNASAAGKSTSELNKPSDLQQRFKTKCKMEINLRKMLEIGFLNNDAKITKLINDSLSNATEPEKAIESAAHRKGRQAGQRLWKMAVEKIAFGSKKK